ncbi:MAG: hypothetical protein LBH15_02570, partial [Treponema sp.]|nr:hypothetical protein [Treponema sp.]
MVYHEQVPDEGLARYTSRRIRGPVVIDGDLSKPCWQNARKSGRFVDMVSGEPAFFDTRMASLWDDSNLYVAYWLEEPSVRASQTERDSLVWFDN